eukprot:9491626-Pyramimonas_sp.AAC.1
MRVPLFSWGVQSWGCLNSWASGPVSGLRALGTGVGGSRAALSPNPNNHTNGGHVLAPTSLIASQGGATCCEVSLESAGVIDPFARRVLTFRNIVSECCLIPRPPHNCP